MLRHLRLVVGLGLFLAAFAGISRGEKSISFSSVTRRLASDACPEDPKAWARAIKLTLESMNSPYELGEVDLKLQNVLYMCPPRVEEAPVIEKCLAPIHRVAPSVTPRDDVGIREIKSTKKGPLVLPPIFNDFDVWAAMHFPKVRPEFVQEQMSKTLAQLPKGSFALEWKSVVAEEGRSFMVAIPGLSEDLFVHANHGENLIIRSVKKESGTTLMSPRMEFYAMVGVGEDPEPRVERCISCHRGGTIKILPEVHSLRSWTPHLSAQDGMNLFDRMRPKISDLSNYDLSHLGPEIGDETRMRTDEFVQECASKVKPDITREEVRVVKNQMKCTGCHLTEGPGLDVLRFPMHAPNFGFRVLDNIILQGFMPKTPITPESLRPALLSCLKAEFFGGFKDPAFSQGNEKPGLLMRALMHPDCPYPKENEN